MPDVDPRPHLSAREQEASCMTVTPLVTIRSVLTVGLAPTQRRRLQSTTLPAESRWTACETVGGLRRLLDADALPAAPDVLVARYLREQAWSVRVVLSQLFRLEGGTGMRVLLVTESPRVALPVFLTDEPRVEVVLPDDVDERIGQLLRRPA
jgi:hypothetical protein